MTDQLTRNQYSEWASAISGAASSASFLRPALAQLRPFQSSEIDIAGVDRWWRVGIGKEFWSYPEREREAILIHECLHVVCRHHARAEHAGQTDHESSNLAQDLEVNQMISELPAVHLPNGSITLKTMPNMPAGQPMETYYQIIHKGKGNDGQSGNSQSQQQSNNQGQQSQQQSGSGSQQSNSDQQQSQQSQNQSGQNKQNNQASSSPNSNDTDQQTSNGGAGQQSDSNSQSNNTSDSSNASSSNTNNPNRQPNTSRSSKNQQSSQNNSQSPSNTTTNRNQQSNAIPDNQICSTDEELLASEADSAGVSKAPSWSQSNAMKNIKKELSSGRWAGTSIGNQVLTAAGMDIGKPRKDWKKVLRSVLSERLSMMSIQKTDYSFMRINKRAAVVVPNVVMPGLIGSSPSILVAVDTSGSVVGDEEALTSLLSELDGVLSMVSHDARGAIRFFCIDTKSHPTQIVKKASELQLQGGGGTDMSPAFAFAKRQHGRDKPDVFILATDGGFNWNKCLSVWPERTKTIILLVDEDANADYVPDWVRHKATVIGLPSLS